MGEIRRLNESYYDPDNVVSFRGARALLGRLAPTDRRAAREWFRAQPAYTRHKRVVTRFPRRKTIVSGPGVQLQADLLDVSRLADSNDGVKFLLTIVDAFSRKGWARPLRSKSGRDVAASLGAFFRNNKGYRLLQTDKGKEFDNAEVARVLREARVRRFTTENETVKASIVERFNRTLRDRLARYMTYRDGDRYADALQPLVDSYNRTPHGSTGVPPAKVDETNQEDVWFRLFEEDASPGVRAPRLSPGDHVRISKARGAFERGYTPNWSEEVFVVSETVVDARPVVYRIRDLAGEDVRGTFYEQELQLVEKPEEFRIAEVIKTRRRRGGKELFVRWAGYPQSFNSWVPERNLTVPR